MAGQENRRSIDEAVSEVWSTDPITGKEYLRVWCYLLDGYERERKEYAPDGALVRHRQFAKMMAHDDAQYMTVYDTKPGEAQ